MKSDVRRETKPHYHTEVRSTPNSQQPQQYTITETQIALVTDIKRRCAKLGVNRHQTNMNNLRKISQAPKYPQTKHEGDQPSPNPLPPMQRRAPTRVNQPCFQALKGFGLAPALLGLSFAALDPCSSAAALACSGHYTCSTFVAISRRSPQAQALFFR